MCMRQVLFSIENDVIIRFTNPDFLQVVYWDFLSIYMYPFKKFSEIITFDLESLSGENDPPD